MTELAQNIEKLRLNLEMSRAEFAKPLGISRISIWRIETGVVEPTLLHKLAIERAYGYSLDTLEQIGIREPSLAA